MSNETVYYDYVSKLGDAIYGNVDEPETESMQTVVIQMFENGYHVEDIQDELNRLLQEDIVDTKCVYEIARGVVTVEVVTEVVIKRS